MRIRGFDFLVARDLADALSLLQEHGSHAELLAGGTDLVLALKRKTVAPPCLISLHQVEELDYVVEEDSRVRIGALTAFDTIATNAIIRQHFPLLAEAAGLIGSWQIRNVATVGGNLCTASAVADSATALLALEAQVPSSGRRQRDHPTPGLLYHGPGRDRPAAGPAIKRDRSRPPRRPVGAALSQAHAPKRGRPGPGGGRFSGRVGRFRTPAEAGRHRFRRRRAHTDSSDRRRSDLDRSIPGPGNPPCSERSPRER